MGGYMYKGKMSVWVRSDMDEMCFWGVGRGNIGEIEVRFFLFDIFCMNFGWYGL